MLRSLGKRLFSANVMLPLVASKRYVFCYHDVSEPDFAAHSPLYSTPPASFRRQIEALSRVFAWVDLDELVRMPKPRRHVAALTFDDGFASVRDVVLPLLREKGIPFTVFICRIAVERNFLPVTTRVLIGRKAEGKREFPELFSGPAAGYDYIRPEGDEAALRSIEHLKSTGLLDEKVYMDVSDVRYLHAQGVRCGSHSSSHRMLAQCDTTSLEEEIGGNRRFLEDELGIRSDHFAIPFGKKEHYTPTVLEAIARHGYRYAYTTNPACVEESDSGRPILVPRIGVSNEDTSRLLFYVNRPLLRRVDL